MKLFQICALFIFLWSFQTADAFFSETTDPLSRSETNAAVRSINTNAPTGPASRSLMAVIEGPDKVEVGKPTWFRVSLPEGSTVAWFPSLDLQTGNPHIQPGSALFWSRKPGRYFIAALVIHWESKQHEAISKVIEVTESPPDPPPPSDLSAFVASLITELDLESGITEVSGFFRDAIPKVNDGSLRGSKAIVEAVSKRIVYMKSVKWQAFSTMLYQHLLNDLKLVTQTQWSDAYKQIVLGLGGSKP